MRSIVPATLLAASSVTYAAPWGDNGHGSWSGSGNHHSGQGGHGGAGGYQPSSPSSSYEAIPTETSTNNVRFPLSNGFPNISNPSAALNQIQEQAHGTLPSSPPPDSVTDDTLTSLRLIAFNELFEVAYFTALIQNITNNVGGYQIPQEGVKSFVQRALDAVQAQEELHALNANEALAHFNADPIQSCEYKFPVDNFDDAIATAAMFTDVVLGTLGDVQNDLGADGDVGLIRLIASVIGQEGEQNGFYRSIGQKIPSALPFLTASTREFAFSALNQNFIVPGSCPNINTIDLPIFGALNVLTKSIQAETQDLQFSFSSESYTSADDLSLVYINQQNLPIVEPLKDVESSNGVVTFTANFPFDEYLMNGLTIAAVATGSSFADVTAVANATLFGPGLIEIN
ncbi:hypothetical protein K431DRAFT_284738 [Polychaeton citri CBS 116435]|uniref:Sexual development protein n=1 Tax=Polychaeton citri CBS 116435 TaxID=1314669 RepID=A0A9P4UQ79_9PEZI|nr:hypothetical protein K431DRAFT_284738 [Polychaeton citri CBS 116435]